jgi:hypothetical protein
LGYNGDFFGQCGGNVFRTGQFDDLGLLDFTWAGTSDKFLVEDGDYPFALKAKVPLTLTIQVMDPAQADPWVGAWFDLAGFDKIVPEAPQVGDPEFYRDYPTHIWGEVKYAPKSR